MITDNTSIENVGNLWWLDGETAYPLQLGVNLVGRLSGIHENDIGINTDDVFMSRRHFTIEVVLNKLGFCDYIVSDNKSKNGTVVVFAANNMKKVLTATDKVYLKNGDMIGAGKTILKLRAVTKRIGEVQDATVDSSEKTQIGG